MHILRWTGLLLVLAALGMPAPVAPHLVTPVSAAPDTPADLQRAFATFINAKELRFDTVPDLYPGGYARISVHAKRANLGGMIVDEAWFRLVGISLDPAALRRGELRILDLRDSAMYIKASIQNLQEYFLQGNPIKDIRLWSDGEYLYGQGTVPVGGLMTKVYLKGFFAVGGTKDVFFYINDLRVNGLPMFSPLIRKWEQDINPVFTQSLWPVTFKIRALRMTKEWFVVSSQADPNAPCTFCTGGDSPTVAP